MNGPSARIVAAVVLVVGALMLLPRLGESGLWDPWEPKYAQAAREMGERDEWVVPHYRDDERVNRPPATYWLIAASHAVFGVSEFSARLPSALLALVAAGLLAWALSSRGRPRAGLVAGLALLSAPQWYLLGRFATPDVPLGAACAAVLAAALAWRARERHLVVLAIAGLVAASLAEWPRGLLLPAWGVLAWRALSGGRIAPAVFVAAAALYHAAQLTYSAPLNLAVAVLVVGAVPWALAASGARPRNVVLAGLVVAALVAPWFVAVSVVAPADELSIFEYKYAFNLGESVERHRGPYWYVPAILAVGGMPWSAAAAAGLTLAFGRRRDRLATIAAGAWFGGVAFFVLAEPRMGHLLSVVQPAQAVLAGLGLVAMLERRRPALVAAAVVFTATLALVVDDPSRLLDSATVKRSLFGVEIAAPALAALAAWAAMVGIAIWRRGAGWLVGAAVPPVVLAVFLGWSVVPTLGPMKSLADHWRVYEARSGGGEPVAFYGPSKDSIYYYSNLGVDRLRSVDELREWLGRPGARWVIARDSDVSRLARVPGAERVDLPHPSHGLVRMVGGGRVDRNGTM